MNAGSGSIHGFRVDPGRGLIPISGSTQPLSAAGTTIDSQFQFDRSGRVPIVDERGSADVLQTFVIGQYGQAEAPRTIPSAGGGPFGFDGDEHGQVRFSNVVLGTSSVGRVSDQQKSPHPPGSDGVWDLFGPWLSAS